MMRNKLLLTIVFLLLFTGCGNAETTEVEPTTEAMHVHNHVEEITAAAGCETEGLKTFSCECGDTYTEVIPETGHIYGMYVSNEDATYLADGTETAKCNGCELTDTRIAEGSKLEYTYTELDKTMYVNKEVNVRDLPSVDGNKLGGLSYAQEVHVIGQCNETSWYKIEVDGGVAYVSNSYLVDEKPVEQVVTTQQTVTIDTPTPSGIPGDTDGNGVVDSQEEYRYIDPEEQALINAGYGNVVWFDATTCAVLAPDTYLGSEPAAIYLYNYLIANGRYSINIVSYWIDASNGYYMAIARDCGYIPQ